MNLAVITARGGSKRIPRKNIKEFCGKPIIAYSIEAAVQSGIFDEVMVSTDSEEIAEVSKRYGAQIPFMRSAETSDDYATTADVLLEVFSEYIKRGCNYEYACCIYPTAPFVTSEKIKTGMEIVRNEDVDAVMPVVAFSFPPQRGLMITNKKVTAIYPNQMVARSQDLETVYHDCGQFYCFNVDSFLKYKSLFCPETIPMIMDELEVQDIDSETDWKLAELKFRLLKKVEQ